MNVRLDDLESVDIRSYFAETFSFISDAINKEKGRVLVHCARGVSRSATLVVMYVMVEMNLDFDQAYEIIRTHRIVACPNEGFVSQLRDWWSNSEKKLGDRFS